MMAALETQGQGMTIKDIRTTPQAFRFKNRILAVIEYLKRVQKK